MQFILVIPATNAASERSLSALRHLKSYLRTTTLQGRMSELSPDMQSVLTEFIGESEHRCGLFAAYIWAQYHWPRLFVTVMWGSYDIKVYYWIYWWWRYRCFMHMDPGPIHPLPYLSLIFFIKNYFAKHFKEKSSSIDSTRWSNSTLRNIVVSHRRPVNKWVF